MKKFRLYKNREVHLSVKFFEKIVSSNSLIVASDPNSVNKKTNLIKVFMTK